MYFQLLISWSLVFSELSVWLRGDCFVGWSPYPPILTNRLSYSHTDHCYVHVVNMMYYFVHENIFAVDKVRNDIAASVQISY
jgi:hypothetical protein